MAQIPIDVDVRDDRNTGRFVVDENGSTAELTYMTEGRLILLRTAVPLSLDRGKGGQLVRAAVNRARTEDLTLVPTCSFARRWLRDHPEAAEGVTIDWTSLRSDSCACGSRRSTPAATTSASTTGPHAKLASPDR